MSLLEYRRNVYSQNGEDGILLEVLRRLGIDGDGHHWCVEFGAWDGKHLSNTFNLVSSANWNAVYIEGESEKYSALEVTASKFPRIRPMLGMVGDGVPGGKGLDEYLATTEIPMDYELLSVDIDSSDLEVWAQHSAYRPKIVIIEINSSIAPGILQWHSSEVEGNSFSSTLGVAAEKGYSLVCHTGNMIFVRNDLLYLVKIGELDQLYPERLFVWDWVLTKGRMSMRARIVRALPKPMLRLLRKLRRSRL